MPSRIEAEGKSNMAENPCPEDRRIFNNATCKLKTALHTLRNENFKTYVSSLSNSDHSIWRPIKSRRKPRLQASPIRKNTTPPGPWAKSDYDKVTLFASHLAEVYTTTATPPT